MIFFSVLSVPLWLLLQSGGPVRRLGKSPAKPTRNEGDEAVREWRFPRNEIISLLDTHRTHNLGESTSQDLRLGELLDEATLAELAELRLGYGSSLGLAALREEIARDCGVAPGEVLVTTGAALALFLVALELCRGAEDEIVVVTPCFPSTVGAMRASGATVRPHRLTFADGYRLNAEALAAGLSERTRLGQPDHAPEPERHSRLGHRGAPVGRGGRPAGATCLRDDRRDL